MLLGNSSQELLLIIPAMNITDQIIEAARSDSTFRKSDIQKKADIFIGEKQIEFYKKKYEELTLLVAESQFSSRLPLSKIISFNEYNDIVSLCRNVFYPLSSHKQIEFTDLQTEVPIMGTNRTPIVNKYYNFSRDHEKGKDLTDYLKDLYTLRWLKQKMGYDTQQYPYKHHLLAFKQDNCIYIWKNDTITHQRLYFDKTVNEEILNNFNSIHFHHGNGIASFNNLIKKLPFVEGDKAKKMFDLQWYKHSKQTPLTYRCFPKINTMIILPDPNPEVCKHSGEYCIDKEEMESRYTRFLNIYHSIDEGLKSELLNNTIELLKKFIDIHTIENANHKSVYEDIIEKLISLKKQLLSKSFAKKIESEKAEPEVFKKLASQLFEIIMDKNKEGTTKIQLDYTTRISKIDQYKYTVEKIKSIQNQISQCPSLIALYINKLLNANPTIVDYKFLCLEICKEFLQIELADQVKRFSNNANLTFSFDRSSEISWNDFIVNINPTILHNVIEPFIDYMLIGHLFITFTVIEDLLKRELKYILSPEAKKSMFPNEKEVFLIEEIENMLADEASRYLKMYAKNQTVNNFEPLYFDKYITDSLLKQFIKLIEDRTKFFTQDEKYNFLNVSLAQFETLIPAVREPYFLRKYFNAYMQPRAFLFTENVSILKYGKYVYSYYARHFHLFRDATQKAMDDYLIDTGITKIEKSIPINREHEVTNKKNKPNNYIIALKWKMTDDLLIRLYKALSDKDIIITNEETFKKAFSGELLEEPLAIVWNINSIKSKTHGVSSLFYFLDKIKSYYQKPDKIKGRNAESRFYDTIYYTFSKTEKLLFIRENLKSAKKYNSIYGTESSSIIDNAVHEISVLCIK